MSSKLEYLKRYGSQKVKKKRKREKKSNINIVDDDVDWQSGAVSKEQESDDSDDAPLVAGVQDESVMKWKPVSVTDVDSLNGSYNMADLSPPRHSTRDFKSAKKDISPPRRKVHQGDRSNGGTSKSKIPQKSHNPPMKSDGASRVGNLSDSGKNAETVYRKRFSDKSTAETMTSEEKDYLKSKAEEFQKWGRGIAQTEAATKQVEDDEYEMSKPLARYVDDEDLEKMLKERTRDGDPMLMFTKKKKEKMAEVKKGKPQYKGSSAPNRFGIHPGYRWDGVNRSNGFEKAWFARVNDSKAIAEVSYKWSVEDM